MNESHRFKLQEERITRKLHQGFHYKTAEKLRQRQGDKEKILKIDIQRQKNDFF
jgi:hypothetical protein